MLAGYSGLTDWTMELVQALVCHTQSGNNLPMIAIICKDVGVLLDMIRRGIAIDEVACDNVRKSTCTES